MHSVVLHHSHVHASLLASGLPPEAVRLADEHYALPVCAWLREDFYPYFQRCLAALGLDRYVPESHDCDDFARLYSALAGLCHRHTPGSAGRGLSVGWLWYRQRGAGAHAAVVALTADLGVVFLEPQTGARLSLTLEERQSASLVVV